MAHFTIPSHVFVGKTALEETIPYMKSDWKKMKLHIWYLIRLQESRQMT